MKTLVSVFCILALVSCIAPQVRIDSPPQIIELKISGVDAVKVEPTGGDIVKTMEVKNTEGQLSSMTFISNGQAYFKVFSYIGSLDSTNLWQDIIVLKSMGVMDLNVMINSGGGSAYDGLALADSLLFARSLGFNVTTHAVGLVASAAIPVFCSGEYRLSTPSAQFMVHKAKLFKYLGAEDVDDLKSQRDMLLLLREKYIDILVGGSSLTYEQWDDKISSTTYFSAVDAKEWGIVHEIK